MTTQLYKDVAIRIKGNLTSNEFAVLMTLVQAAGRLANPDVTVEIIGVNGQLKADA
jgi:hypothetical protein